MNGLRAQHWSPRDVRAIERHIGGVSYADLELCAFTIGKYAASQGVDVPNPFRNGAGAPQFDRAYRAGHEVGTKSKEQSRWLRAERARLGLDRDPLSVGAITERAAVARAFPLIQRRG